MTPFKLNYAYPVVPVKPPILDISTLSENDRARLRTTTGERPLGLFVDGSKVYFYYKTKDDHLRANECNLDGSPFTPYLDFVGLVLEDESVDLGTGPIICDLRRTPISTLQAKIEFVNISIVKLGEGIGKTPLRKYKLVPVE